MKSILNIICGLIFITLIFSFYQTMAESAASFKDGFNKGYGETYFAESYYGTPVSLTPYTNTTVPDSIYNTKTKSYTPAYISKIGLVIDGNIKESSVNKWIVYLFQGVEDILLFLAILYFIRFIVKVNKNEIFSHRNILRLRIISGLLVASFIFSSIAAFCLNSTINNGFAMANYEIFYSSRFNIIPLLLGLVSLLAAQIFEMALRMKEEQELTI